MKSIAVIGWIIIGLLQFSAMVSGFVDTLGGFFGIAAALLLGQVPILGTIMGIIGAMSSWGWSLIQSIGLFIGAPIGIMVINAIAFKDKD
ncbi:hypothetical protein [Gracilinema caldarium]|uniref:Uncharacterized protein n=1 Tax=Gracilinema caldarium (strain ATCC 51460 / DSM 7334 / H1) TaxID=744872 RepID=F8F2X2_GRAC1|nr:hypothetical protein [Gracilinema caldarium]AEJ19880.1 hypothetical protein Spica_1738 [Gracilinema caldarium DSM 7334]